MEKRDYLTLLSVAGMTLFSVCKLCACSVQEEVKQIEEVRRVQKRQAASTSTNLTGEQVFIRSCNTCHDGTHDAIGPSLEMLGKRYADDHALKDFIRKGKGMMPPQPPETLNDEELDNLVSYLRSQQLR